jgi:hypothetical protein
VLPSRLQFRRANRGVARDLRVSNPTFTDVMGSFTGVMLPITGVMLPITGVVQFITGLMRLALTF